MHEAVAAVSQRTEAVVHAMGHVQQAVAKRVCSYTGKDSYQFGDLTRALLSKAKLGMQGQPHPEGEPHPAGESLNSQIGHGHDAAAGGDAEGAPEQPGPSQ